MTGHIAFDREAFQQFRTLGPGPVHMLNLLRFKPLATGPDRRSISGREAYRRYGDLSAPILAELGGRIIWSGAPETALIAAPGEVWDHAFVAEYPSPQVFEAMMRDPLYKAAMAWRQCALMDSRLIALRPRQEASNFGSGL